MNRYIATFHTHLSALLSARALQAQGVEAKLAPVPRQLSSSCGTCVIYEADGPLSQLLNHDVEGIYQAAEAGKYIKLSEYL